MDEEIKHAAQELVEFLNKDVLTERGMKTNASEAIAGVERWVLAFNGDAEALEEYHKRWTKLAKLIAKRGGLPKKKVHLRKW
jgi:hypothetical protein